MYGISSTVFGTCTQKGCFHTGTDLEHCKYMDKTERFCLEAEQKEEFFYYSRGLLSHPDVLAIDLGWSPHGFEVCF